MMILDTLLYCAIGLYFDKALPRDSEPERSAAAVGATASVSAAVDVHAVSCYCYGYDVAVDDDVSTALQVVCSSLSLSDAASPAATVTASSISKEEVHKDNKLKAAIQLNCEVTSQDQVLVSSTLKNSISTEETCEQQEVLENSTSDSSKCTSVGAPRNQACSIPLPNLPVHNATIDSFSSIAAVINSESQVDTAVQIDSMVTSSRRRADASRLSEVDSGDSRAPRHRLSSNGGAVVLRSCDHVPQHGEEPCPIYPWLIVPDKSKYVDEQTLKLQENPEDDPTRELPGNLLLSVDQNLVQTVVPLIKI
ncbi:hypothetical protein KIW84_062823 [Lathyrus oleraceus]|uniref:MCM OB domain-containing protein n=1 Tax=Pisum sativum TaxID=3888 RepID=A0A9D4W805_PEA|nr:hypothetical protein KIW84_062823 [Pisum sativum]